MKQLKFKSSKFEAISCAYLCTLLIVFLCVAFLFVVFSLKEEHNLKAWLIGFAIALAGVWLLAGLAILLGKTVVITSSEIKMCRGKKVKWILKKEEIEKCIYNNLKWYEIIIPFLYYEGVSTLFFVLQRNGKISRNSCKLSQRQINRIKANFDYPIEETKNVNKKEI